MAFLYRQFSTQQEIDAEYDVEKSVPDFMVYARHFIEESKLARHRLKCELDVPYGATRDEHLDIFPAANRRAPILIFFHGGYWRMLSSKEFSCVALGPAPAGVTVVNVNYSLCPKVTIDEIVRQARAAVAWTYRHAEDFGGDRERIFVSGIPPAASSPPCVWARHGKTNTDYRRTSSRVRWRSAECSTCGRYAIA